MTVALVGQQPQARDPTFGRLRAALDRQVARAGLSVVLKYHEAGDVNDERLRHAVQQAIDSRPAVLVLPTGDSASVGAAAAARPPIVFASSIDPVRLGIVDGLRQPGRRTTGVSSADDLHLKRLELLKDAFPQVRRVALLADRSWLGVWSAADLTAAANAQFDLDLVVYTADNAEELDLVMRGPAAAAADAWYIAPTYTAYIAEAALIGHLQRLRRPAIHTTLGAVARGAVMAYSQDTSFAIDAMAALTLRVAAGEDAGSIPIERPRRYVLSVRVADAPEWARVAPSVVRRADRLY